MSGKKKIVCVSGGFDPLHAGHIRLIKEARRLGNALVVILNNDNWLLQKKKFVFMKEKERKEVLEALRNVDRVVISSHKKGTGDTSVSAELKRIKPSFPMLLIIDSTPLWPAEPLSCTIFIFPTGKSISS